MKNKRTTGTRNLTMPVDKAKTARTHSKGVSESRLNSAKFAADFLSAPQTWEGRPVPAKFARMPHVSAQSRGTRFVSGSPASECAASGSPARHEPPFTGPPAERRGRSPLLVGIGLLASASPLLPSIQTLDNTRSVFVRNGSSFQETLRKIRAKRVKSLTSRSICDKVIARWRSV
jgi:hypothetical protein